MSTANAYLTARGIDIDVIYKNIRNLHIGAYPPMGRVRVAAPQGLDDDQIRIAIVQRLPWMKRQQAQLKEAPRQTEREMTTGESHYAWGNRLRLKVIEHPGSRHVEVEGGRLALYTSGESTAAERRDLLDRWYREQLRQAVPPLITKWEAELKVTVPKWTIRRMKTMWGSCNRESRHLWFNLDLAKKYPDCLEYIVVHEMTNYFERHHGERFAELMDKQFPDWRVRREELNGSPLASEEWAVNEHPERRKALPANV